MPRAIDPELPWGYWLRLEKEGQNLRYVDDRNGAEWKSLRAAFWSGRMGMPSDEGDAPESLLEVVHAILAILSRRQVARHELASDLFEGNRIAAEMFAMCSASAA